MLAVGGAMIMKGMDDSAAFSGGGGDGELMSNWGLFVVALGAFTSAVYYIIQKPTLVGGALHVTMTSFFSPGLPREWESTSCLRPPGLFPGEIHDNKMTAKSSVSTSAVE